MSIRAAHMYTYPNHTTDHLLQKLSPRLKAQTQLIAWDLIRDTLTLLEWILKGTTTTARWKHEHGTRILRSQTTQ